MTKLMTTLLGILFLVHFSAQASETVKGAQKDLEKFKTEMSAKLITVEKELEELRAKAKTKSSAAQEKVISDLEATRAQLQGDLAAMKESSQTDWKKIKHDFAESLNRLNSKIQKALKD